MSEISTNFSINDIKNILLLDDGEYDINLNNILDKSILESIEPILITKIMGFDENYEDANKYLLEVIKMCNEEQYDKYKTPIYNIIKLFLFDQINVEYSKKLFNNINKYKNRKYLVNLFEQLNFSELNTWLANLQNIEKINKYEIINILTRSKSIRKILLAKYSTGKLYEKQLNFFSLIVLENDYDINDDLYYQSINNYLQDTESLDEFLNYINDILDKNKLYGSNLANSNYTELSSSRYLALVLKISLIIFKNIDKSKIFYGLEKNFITTIRKDFIISTDTIETKAYIYALKSMKIIHNTMIILYNDIKNMMANNGMFFSLMFNVPSQNLTNKLKIAENIIFSKSLNDLIHELINYYTNEFFQINNDVVDTVIQYYFNMVKIYPAYQCPDSILNYFFKLLGTSSEYCNKHFKFDILSLICSIYDKDEIINNIVLLEAIIIYHDENDMFKIEVEPIAHKLYQSSLNIVEKILNTAKIEENSMNTIFLKFFYRTNSHTISFLEFLNKTCDEISTHRNIFTEKYKVIVSTIMKSISISLKIAKNILDKKILNPAIFRGEIILPIITLATNVLKFFTNGNNPIYNVFNMNFEALDIMKYSLYILHKLTSNEEFKELIQETKNIVIDALPYIKFPDSDKYVKDELKDNLEYKNDDIRIENVPDEFLDPLIYTIIRDPVMIPNVDLMFDKSSIVSQIYHEKINPYTREFLDENILELYNRNPKIIEKVKEFTDKFTKWKKN